MFGTEVVRGICLSVITGIKKTRTASETGSPSYEVPRWGTGTHRFRQPLSCKVGPDACGSLCAFPFVG